MTTERDAIIHLQKSANMLEMNEALKKEDTKTPTMLVPDGFDIVDLETYMKYRSSYRFKYKTTSIDDFVEYSREFDKLGSKCFIDADRMNAEIIFDIGIELVPEHQQNKASLSLDKTSAYKKLLSIQDYHYSQKDASDFIEDWGDFITIASRTGESMTIAQAANALNKITIEEARTTTSEIGDFAEGMSSMERAEVKQADKIPANIIFKCKPYLGLCLREFNIRVSILTGGEKPEISFRVIQLEPIQEDIVKEFKELLVDKFKERQLKTFIGKCG